LDEGEQLRAVNQLDGFAGGEVLGIAGEFAGGDDDGFVGVFGGQPGGQKRLGMIRVCPSASLDLRLLQGVNERPLVGTDRRTWR